MRPDRVLRHSNSRPNDRPNALLGGTGTKLLGKGPWQESLARVRAQGPRPAPKTGALMP